MNGNYDDDDDDGLETTAKTKGVQFNTNNSINQLQHVNSTLQTQHCINSKDLSWAISWLVLGQF